LHIQAGERAYMTLEEVLEVAQAGKEAGCTEALFTLGDKPELLYTEAKEEVRQKYGPPLAFVLRA
jgi:FO synthase